jgi:hypothetical protein
MRPYATARIKGSADRKGLSKPLRRSPPWPFGHANSITRHLATAIEPHDAHCDQEHDAVEHAMTSHRPPASRSAGYDVLRYCSSSRRSSDGRI